MSSRFLDVLSNRHWDDLSHRSMSSGEVRPCLCLAERPLTQNRSSLVDPLSRASPSRGPWSGSFALTTSFFSVCVVDVRRRHARWQSSHRPRCRLAHAYEHHRIRGLSAFYWRCGDGLVIKLCRSRSRRCNGSENGRRSLCLKSWPTSSISPMRWAHICSSRRQGFYFPILHHRFHPRSLNDVVFFFFDALRSLVSVWTQSLMISPRRLKTR